MADLDTALASPPRLQGRILDVWADIADAGDPAVGWNERVVLRLFTGDVYEARRDGPDRFVANHLLDEPEVIVYLSWGEAELDAEEIGWDAYLRRALGTVLSAVAEHDGVFATGRYTPTRIASHTDDILAEWGQPFTGALEWRTGGWTAATLGSMVDLTEAQVGYVGFSEEPFEPGRAAATDPDCVACQGRPLYIPHQRPTDLLTLCDDHAEQLDRETSLRIPSHSGEAKRELGDVMLAVTEPLYPAGLQTRLWVERTWPLQRRRDLFDDTLDWYRDRPDLLERAFDSDYGFFDFMHRVIGDTGSEVGAGAAEDMAERLRRQHQTDCWAVDNTMVGVYGENGRTEDEVELIEHLVSHAGEMPLVYEMVGDHLEDRKRFAAAETMYRKGFATGVVRDLESVAMGALVALRRLSRTNAEDSSAGVAEVDALIAKSDARGLRSLRPGRNEPCLCNSGRKSKHCCG